MALGTSYLHFAPQLGYEASVFNLVYVTNKASYVLPRLCLTTILITFDQSGYLG